MFNGLDALPDAQLTVSNQTAQWFNNTSCQRILTKGRTADLSPLAAVNGFTRSWPPHQIRCSLDPHESPQNGNSISSTVFAGLTIMTSKQTDTQTDRPRYSICPHLMHWLHVMQPHESKQRLNKNENNSSELFLACPHKNNYQQWNKYDTCLCVVCPVEQDLRRTIPTRCHVPRHLTVDASRETKVEYLIRHKEHHLSQLSQIGLKMICNDFFWLLK